MMPVFNCLNEFPVFRYNSMPDLDDTRTAKVDVLIYQQSAY